MRSWLRRDSERPLVFAPGPGQRMQRPSGWRAEHRGSGGDQRDRQPFVKDKERPGGVRSLQVPAERCPKAGRLAVRGWSASLCGSSLREGAGSALWRELAPEGGTVSERERSRPDESPQAQRSRDVLQQYGRCGNGAGDADRPIGVRWSSCP